MGQPLTGRDIEIINESFENMSRVTFLYTLIGCVIFFLCLCLYFNSQLLF